VSQLAFARLPKGATFHNQTLRGAIGWATPAAFGAAVAAPDHRVVLITGDGSYQVSAQEISQFGRRGLRPIIFVLDNFGYLIERLIAKDPPTAYRRLALRGTAARSGMRRLVHLRRFAARDEIPRKRGDALSTLAPPVEPYQ
jgi:TPP-dependent trihydroxycyclohexane-1,2-dione (THcHDO) dehydratase